GRAQEGRLQHRRRRVHRAQRVHVLAAGAGREARQGERPQDRPPSRFHELSLFGRVALVRGPPRSTAYDGRWPATAAVGFGSAAVVLAFADGSAGSRVCSSRTGGGASSSSCSEFRPFLKLFSAWPRLAPSCGSFEGPKKSRASTRMTTISPIPSLIASSGAAWRSRHAAGQRRSVLPAHLCAPSAMKLPAGQAGLWLTRPQSRSPRRDGAGGLRL